MREIGGYLELDRYELPMLHDGAIALNCGRSCLRYLIKVHHITKILLPKFLCDSVIEVCKKEHVVIRYYSIKENFMPLNIENKLDEWIYIVNYYGQLNNEQLQQIVDRYKNVIIDQTQAYYQLPIKGVDTFYSCRKFFGVADGAFLYTDTVLYNTFPQDESYHRMNYLLGRYEKSATEFYCEYVSNNESFSKEPIKKMSKLTDNLLHGINYNKIRGIRTNNYRYLYEKFALLNKLELNKPEGAFMYPLYIEDGNKIRQKLRLLKIYIPILWPNVLNSCKEDECEYQMAKNILPLPCDQRYTEEEMIYMVEQIKSIL